MTTTESGRIQNHERLVLTFVWVVAGVSLLYLIVRDATKTLYLLSIGPRASALVLAIIATACLACFAVALSLFACWNRAAIVAIVVTYPITLFSVWALIWCLVALLALPSMTTLGVSMAPVLAMVIAHRTRRVARQVGR